MIIPMRSHILAAALAVLATAAGAGAQPPDSVLLEELTWTEVRDAVRAGKTTIIIPAGGTEQNGPHMALGKHNARVKILAQHIARQLGDALVAPVIAYVPEGAIAPPTAHMRYPGTITTPDDAFQKVLEWAARSFKQHGFRNIVLLGDHGSTQAGQKAVAARLNREWVAGGARVHAIEEYYRAAETEVRADRLRPGSPGDGVDGDPSRATAELGRPGVELIVSRTVDAVRKSISHR
jgi:creatinine amidohydrolase